MAQETQTAAMPKVPGSLRNLQFASGVVLIVALTLLVYGSVLAKLVTDWWEIPDFSHGFLVPIFSAYLIWA